jgi:hypothetical protein
MRARYSLHPWAGPRRPRQHRPACARTKGQASEPVANPLGNADLVHRPSRHTAGEVGRVAQSSRHCMTRLSGVHCRVPAHADATTSRMTTGFLAARLCGFRQPIDRSVQDNSAITAPRAHVSDWSLRSRARDRRRATPATASLLSPTALLIRSHSHCPIHCVHRWATTFEHRWCNCPDAEESGAIVSRVPDSGVMCWHGR